MRPKIVLIRGLFRGKFHWGTFLDHLQATFPDKQILCLDIPGVGERTNELSPCSIEGMVESLRTQLDLTTPVDVVSISMGGMIGLKWAEMYPSEIDRLVCINTSSRGASPFYYRLKPNNYVNLLLALIVSVPSRELLNYQMLSNQALRQDILDAWVLLDQKYPMRKINFFRQLYAAMWFKASLPECELFFVSSTQDSMVDYRATQALAKKWNANLIINEQDGHDIPLDNPIWLCEKLSYCFNRERG